MALSDDEVEKQIRQMKQFISQEANEKADEILVKAEEEFNIEKGRLLQTEKLKIDNYYDRKEKQVELQRKIQHSTLLNQARLSVLKAKDDHIKRILEEARQKIGEITRDIPRYQQLLKDLITQGLYQLLEKEVLIRCRKQDYNLIKAIYESAVLAYKKGTGNDCTVTLDDKEFLPPDCSGGIDMYTQQGKIKLTNTLESRLELLSGQMMPEIRSMLFGDNPSRHFRD
ncbi:PREDICTED: V-type proton ATPase subunit E 1-like [Amphimedon queenslandica]|uniref:Uncharacterized protein n=1 Tax=Amphimedon queenslandica TaxID=400682 RepID=A0A1X7VQF5_AMPQE|nr:PREDICTED: V-type proton ATPase subunit E 1-like [Amphimedon queenslandica]|eukprot:XP_003383410.1 PREDICTED: V-type proton ATPase subunit E 1-like [Amphimedon queenslandica]